MWIFNTNKFIASEFLFLMDCFLKIYISHCSFFLPQCKLMNKAIKLYILYVRTIFTKLPVQIQVNITICYLHKYWSRPTADNNIIVVVFIVFLDVEFFWHLLKFRMVIDGKWNACFLLNCTSFKPTGTAATRHGNSHLTSNLFKKSIHIRF